MKKIGGVLRGIFSLAIIIILIVLAWALFTSMVKVFGDYTSTVEPTITVAIISGLVAIIVNAVSKSSERKNQVFLKSKEKMVVEYKAFFNELSNAIPKEEVAEVFKKYHSIFAVNSSDDTYNEYCDAQKLYEDKKQLDLSRLIVSIRKEIKVSTKSNPK